MARNRSISELSAMNARVSAYNDWAYRKFGAGTREYNRANKRSSFIHTQVSKQISAKGNVAG